MVTQTLPVLRGLLFYVFLLVFYLELVNAQQDVFNATAATTATAAVTPWGLEALSPESISRLCFAQCHAKCTDSNSGIHITPMDGGSPGQAGMKTPVGSIYKNCTAECHMFRDTEWQDKCNGDQTCLHQCLNLSDGSDQQDAEIPKPPTVELHQAGPYIVQLNWSMSCNLSKPISIFYVVESRKPGEEVWSVVDQTNSTSMTTGLGSCSVMKYRVASVSQYGTLGYPEHTYIRRNELPRPGPIRNLRAKGPTVAEEQRFVNIYTFNAPEDWNPHDLDYKLMSSGKYCDPSVIMSAPSPEMGIAETVDGKVYVKIYVGKNAYSCIYNVSIEPNNIGCFDVLGEGENFTLDYSDCEEIEGFSCPTTATPGFTGPGSAEETSLTQLEGSMFLRAEWTPPTELGQLGYLDYYVVLWGPVVDLVGITEEGRKNVSGNETSYVFEVQKSGIQYGVKVQGMVMIDPRTKEDIEQSLAWMHVSASLWVTPSDQAVKETTEENRATDHNILSRTPPINTKFPSSETSDVASVTMPSGDIGSQQQNGGMTDMLPVYIMTPIAAVLLVLIGGVVYVQRVRARAKKKQWAGNTDPFHQYNIFMLQKQVKGCLKENPFYQKDIMNLQKKDVPPPDRYEIPRSCLTLGDVLGQGAFGQVVRGTLQTTLLPVHGVGHGSNTSLSSLSCKPTEITVAVKLLLDFAEETHRQDFLKEMELMKTIGQHPNVVSMIGCVTYSEPLCLVVEHMAHGDLLHYLRRHRHWMQEGCEEGEEEEPGLTVQDLLSFARQIAVGMEFLSQKGFVHRDLATRNILVENHRTVKIGDFGLTRYVYDDKVYVTKKGCKLPLKWMAIEAIFDLTFTTASDVWAFGVMLFEIITLGGTPYPTIANRDLLRELKSGYRMERPDNCSEELYELMLQCWQERPASRPSFTNLRNQLDDMLERHSSADYLTFDLDENKDYYRLGNSIGESEDAADVFDVINLGCGVQTVGGTVTSSSLSSGIGSACANPLDLPREGCSSAVNKFQRCSREDPFRTSTCSNDQLLPGVTSDLGSSDGSIYSLEDHAIHGETQL